VATENSVCVNVPDVGWKWVPSSRSCNSKWAVGKVCSSTSYSEITAYWWSETAVVASAAQVGQVPGRRSVENVEHQNALFILYAFGNRKPM